MFIGCFRTDLVVSAKKVWSWSKIHRELLADSMGERCNSNCELNSFFSCSFKVGFFIDLLGQVGLLLGPVDVAFQTNEVSSSLSMPDKDVEVVVAYVFKRLLFLLEHTESVALDDVFFTTVLPEL